MKDMKVLDLNEKRDSGKNKNDFLTGRWLGDFCPRLPGASAHRFA
jgi:hypothetical protein